MTLLGQEEVLSLLERLIQLTAAGKLQWASSSQSSFEASTDRFKFRVLSRDGDGLHPFSFAAEAERGVIAAEDTGQLIDAVTSDRIARLYHAARRQALGIDQIAQELEEDLNQLDPRPDYGPDEAPF